MENWMRRKSIINVQTYEKGCRLVTTLTWPHLIALGIGGIVGTGIYTLIGIGAERAGPAVLFAFVISGVVCACSAFAYAELATMIPVSGGAYAYSYTAFGEILAWIVGWSLILEYSLVVSTVAVGWSAYVVVFLKGFGINLPFWITTGLDNFNPITNVRGLINLPAVLIVFVIAGMLLIGTKESAMLNSILVIVKISALLLFVAVALPHFNPSNLHPFMPFGFMKSLSADGVERGVMAAAAIIFFVFYGFDTIATAAEETRNPKRDLSIAIIGSLAGCILIYVLVGLSAVGALSYTIFDHSAEPLALILRELNSGLTAKIIAAAAVVSLPTVLLAFFYGQTRILFAMARDGLLPHTLSKVHSKKGTPVITTVFTAVIIGCFAGVARLDEIAALANAGTLVAFMAVGACMLILRVREPDIARKFRVPAVWIIGPLAILGCIYLFYSLPTRTQYWFLIWNIIGFAFYFVYGRQASVMNRKKG